MIPSDRRLNPPRSNDLIDAFDHFVRWGYEDVLANPEWDDRTILELFGIFCGQIGLDQLQYDRISTCDEKLPEHLCVIMHMEVGVTISDAVERWF